MKKNMLGLGVVIMVAMIAGAYWYRMSKSVPVVVPEPAAMTTEFVATTTPTVVGSPKDAIYLIEGVPVALVSGVAETPVAFGSASVNQTEYFGNEVSYDFNNDGRMDTAFLLTQSTGGTGVFFYVLAALSFPDGYQGSVAFRLGDRIAPQGTRLSTEQDRLGVIEVTYADRAPGESFAVAPSVGKSVLLKFDPAAMQFGMVESDFSGEADSLIVKLDQKKWQWVKTSYTDGKVFVAKKAEAFTLTFTAGGTVSATTDCNGVSGTYTAGSGALTFGTLASTLMFCDGSEEGVFTEMLDQVASYAFTSKGELELGLQAGTGKMIFQ